MATVQRKFLLQFCVLLFQQYRSSQIGEALMYNDFLVVRPFPSPDKFLVLHGYDCIH